MAARPVSRLFNFSYVNKYVRGPFADRLLEIKSNPLEYKTLDTYKNRPRSGLWISIMANTSMYKKVVRVKATRKMKMALHEILANQGYSADGRSLVATKPDLRGSLVLYPIAYVDILHQPKQLTSNMRNLVRWLAWLDDKKMEDLNTQRTGQKTNQDIIPRLIYTDVSKD